MLTSFSRNDDNEQERLDLQHEIFKLLLEGELAATPIEETGWHILDIGTGTGIWSIDVGDAHPSATIIGVDESPIQPSVSKSGQSFPIRTKILVGQVRHHFRRNLISLILLLKRCLILYPSPRAKETNFLLS